MYSFPQLFLKNIAWGQFSITFLPKAAVGCSYHKIGFDHNKI